MKRRLDFEPDRDAVADFMFPISICGVCKWRLDCPELYFCCKFNENFAKECGMDEDLDNDDTEIGDDEA